MASYLCSQLVALSWEGGSTVVNLEEIGPAACVLECEDAVPVGMRAEIRWDGVMLAGRLTAATEHEFGWRVEMEFSALTPWSRERGEPAHLLEITVPDIWNT